MPTEENTLLIADLYGRISEQCEPGPVVHGEVWLRRHESTLFVYWEAWELPFKAEDSAPRWQPGYTALAGMVSRSAGMTRWQAIAVVETEKLGDQLSDLVSAFGDSTKREVLLQKALSAIAGQIYLPMGRGRF